MTADYIEPEEPADEETALPEYLPDVLTARELAAYLRVSYRVVVNMAKAGEVPAFQVAGQWRFLRADVDRWLLVLSRREYTGPDLPDLSEEDDSL